MKRLLFCLAGVAVGRVVLSAAFMALLGHFFRLNDQLEEQLDDLGRQQPPPPDEAYIHFVLDRIEASADYVARQMETNR